MPPKKTARTEKTDSAEAAVFVKKSRRISAKVFGTGALHHQFHRHVSDAQEEFLRGNTEKAEAAAVQALRIRPTPQLFALLSVIAESKGQFDRASDFRLLQAFLARDVTLWEELLHDFLSQQLFYKSVVCLTRMAALEKNPARYRALQLQLADLLVGLGEIRRATHVLVPLWNSSKCRDFEVFALLSSLYFQLGKWTSLQRLVASSLKNAFDITFFNETATTAAPEAAAAVEVGRKEKGNEEEEETQALTQAEAEEKNKDKPARKRVRFSDLEEDKEATKPAVKAEPQPAKEDEFGFDELTQPQLDRPASPTTTTGSLKEASASVHGLYGDRIDLGTPAQKRNFLTLINVHTELLNESGKFEETVALLEYAAASLEVPLLDLPPDLLVRLGTAYAFLGRAREQPCREVFASLLETCSMEDYGDVLLDAAVSLQKVGMHTEALTIFGRFATFYQFSLARNTEAVQRAEGEAEAASQAALRVPDAGHAAAQQRAQQQLADLRAEHAEMQTVMAAARHGSASSLLTLRHTAEAEAEAKRALEADPTHLQSRLLLGCVYFYHNHDLRSAVAVLTPRPDEPALQRIQLGALLVRVFFKAREYVEAIAVGVTLFGIILASSEDGDTESVAPGSVRRHAAPLLMPTLSRASSAIVPAASLVSIAQGGLTATTTTATTATGSVARLSTSLAASIRAGTSVYRQQFDRRGRSALTTTVYGASAAASVAAGWSRQEEEERLKDSSTIFSFVRRRKPRPGVVAEAAAGKKRSREGGEAVDNTQANTAATTAAVVEEVKEEMAEEDVEVEEEEVEEQERRRRERREAVTTQASDSFWELPGTEESAEEISAIDSTGDETVKQEQEEEEKAVTTTAETQTADPATPVSKAEDTKEKMLDRDKVARVGLSGRATTAGEKDRDLEELEAFEQAMLEEGMLEGDADAPDPQSYELPSLEEISERFGDPSMAEIFLQASSNEKKPDADANADGTNPFATAAAATAGAAGGVGSGPADRVTIREAMTALGKMEFMQLMVTIVDAYSMLDRFDEAKDFAFIALSRIGGLKFFRQMGPSLERPLRLALLRAAMAAGHGEDAFRVGLRLLQDDQSVEERNEVIELMHGVLNRCEDRSGILLRVFTEGACDVPLLVLLGNRYYQTRSYTRVLNLYLCALQERPSDVFLNFMTGLCYLFSSHQKSTKPREAAVSAAVYYLSQYQGLLAAVDPSRAGEALYNSARALHFLKLHYLCVPLYQRVAHDLLVPARCSLAVQRAARVNLYLIYSTESENRRLALSALPHVAEAE